MDSAAVDADEDPEGRRRPTGILSVAVRAMRVLGAVHALDRAAPVIDVAGHYSKLLTVVAFSILSVCFTAIFCRGGKKVASECVSR